jgi:hypothetical protein
MINPFSTLLAQFRNIPLSSASSAAASLSLPSMTNGGVGSTPSMGQYPHHSLQLSPNSIMLNKKQSRPTFTGHQVGVF